MPTTKAAQTHTKSANLFPVVGIGASAGGLDAFKKLLKASSPPADAPMPTTGKRLADLVNV